MKKITLLLSGILLSIPLVSAADQVWNLSSDGNGGLMRGTWTQVSGNAPGPIYFNGIWFLNSTNISSKVTMHITSNNYVTAQESLSDGQTCVYTGTLSENNVASGTFICNESSGYYKWSATIAETVR